MGWILWSSPSEAVWLFVISDCNHSIPKEMFIAIQSEILEFSILSLYVLHFAFFSQGLAEFLEWTWVNVMILYTVEEITTAHRYLKNYIDNLKTSI